MTYPFFHKYNLYYFLFNFLLLITSSLESSSNIPTPLKSLAGLSSQGSNLHNSSFSFESSKFPIPPISSGQVSCVIIVSGQDLISLSPSPSLLISLSISSNEPTPDISSHIVCSLSSGSMTISSLSLVSSNDPTPVISFHILDFISSQLSCSLLDSIILLQNQDSVIVFSLSISSNEPTPLISFHN